MNMYMESSYMGKILALFVTMCKDTSYKDWSNGLVHVTDMGARQ